MKNQQYFLVFLFSLIPFLSNAQISSKAYCEMEKFAVDSILEKFDRKPSFKGASDSSLVSNKIMRYVGRNVGLYEGQGIVCLSFIINEQGRPEDVTAYKSQNEELSKLSVDLIERMPRWKPGILNNEKVKVRFRVPFRFVQP